MPKSSSGNRQPLQIDNYFHTDHLQTTLKRRSVLGGITTLVAQVLKFTLTLVSNIVLARMLTPADFGLVGMVTAVIGFVQIFKDLGLSMAVVQKEDINHEQVSTLFWINIVFSLVITLITIFLSPLVAQFYKEPRLIRITIALSLGIFISSLGIQHAALLKRQMHYTALAQNEVLAQIIGVATAMICAHYLPIIGY